ncbi:MAG TPA: trehalose-6-phosphate synthase [Thermodesulfobacteriota bacterium]|nr:trehalose-6-phosphate synthase [Thermodesulfobacteriota bacterium]
MKITLRLILALILAVTGVAGVSSYFTVQSEKARLTSELEHRAWLVSEGLKESVGRLVLKGPSRKLDMIVEKIGAGKQIMGMAVYNAAGQSVAISKELPAISPSSLNILFEESEGDEGKGAYEVIASKRTYLYAVPTYDDEGARTGAVVIFSDASYIDEYLFDIWRRNFLRILANAFLISVITLLVVRWSITGPIARMSEWIGSLRSGRFDEIFKMPKEDIFAPISKEISSLAKSLALAHARAEEEAMLRSHAEAVWTAERLKAHVRAKFGGKNLIAVSNREPFMHIRRGKAVECVSPASGLVTALDPILKACGGLWLAHGSGNADKETVDRRNMVRVPPENPQYDLKRVWLTQEEEEGYYYGFSNEGLWPLCHISHVRPVFRINDWARYQEVNLKFARSLEDAVEDETYIFIQDYHFAILPRIIKERHPNAKIALFWHIPWPNPEAFSICPWRREILHGMLGADIIGFHTQFHCNNFLETVDRTLECRTNWERFSVTRMGHTTIVKPFPISVDFTPPPFNREIQSKEELFKDLGVKASIMGVGVDRLDYTKGILERFRAIERFLEKHSEYRGLFTFVQIAAPSREHIKSYHDFAGDARAEADRINWRFQSGGWRPIVFEHRHFSHAEIEPYYRRADLCMVTSLHDGMNLVAKEFVVSREDEQGVLILSTFTGASRELRDALLVNPYDTEQVADMIKVAIEMDKEEQGLRMKRMRAVIRENNIYKWAADIITDLAQIRKG